MLSALCAALLLQLTAQMLFDVDKCSHSALT